MTTSLGGSTIRMLTPAVLLAAVWFGAILAMAHSGVFQTRPDTPPVAVGVAVAVPPLIVVAALAYSARFRAWARGLDLRFLTMLQTWRVAGLSFIALSAQEALPAGFAGPAGYGDIAVGVTAPLVAVYVLGSGPRAKGVYYGWNFFGIADLVIAVILGVLHSNTEPMAMLPMSMIPTFGVPLTLALHAISLVNASKSDLFARRS